MPGVKLAADIKSWHPYASYAYSHNAYNDAKIQIEDFTLPEFMPKDYSEYSFGIENTLHGNLFRLLTIHGILKRNNRVLPANGP